MLQALDDDNTSILEDDGTTDWDTWKISTLIAGSVVEVRVTDYQR